MGTREGNHLDLRNRTPAELEAKFPKLKPGNHKHASEATARYNCVAFANGDHRHLWEAGKHGGRYFWPPGIADTLDGWTEIFTKKGYEKTDSRESEPGFEKIAIYIDLDDLLPGHIAISDGRVWKSKLGRLQDIEHASLDLLEGDQGWEYGVVDRILKKKIAS
jgi:hypothetical protein